MSKDEKTFRTKDRDVAILLLVYGFYLETVDFDSSNSEEDHDWYIYEFELDEKMRTILTSHMQGLVPKLEWHERFSGGKYLEHYLWEHTHHMNWENGDASRDLGKELKRLKSLNL